MSFILINSLIYEINLIKNKILLLIKFFKIIINWTEESDTAKTEFLSERIQIKGVPCSFQVASVRKKWAMRVIDEKDNKVLKVVKLDKVTSAAITDNIRDIVGRKYSLQEYKIDELDLGSKMSGLLRNIDTFQKTGVVPKTSKSEPGAGKPTQPKLMIKKPSRQPDSFWSAYSTAVTNPPNLASEEDNVQPEASSNSISFEQPTTTESESATPTVPVYSEDLDETLSILGVKCPVCGAELDPDADKCPHCGTKIEE
ncbi:MAG: zinc ribbon domain-containing protein [Candidatus Helarchaeota archaeon]